MEVNKRELANILGWSLPKLDQWLIRHVDRFPVLERGGHGREYRFDSDSVSAFVHSLEARRNRDRAERAVKVAQLALPRLRPDGDRAFDRRQIGWLSDALETMQDQVAAAIRRRCVDEGVTETTLQAIQADCDAATAACLRHLMAMVAAADQEGGNLGF